MALTFVRFMIFPCLSLCLCLCCFLNLNVNNNPTTQQWNEEAAGGGRLTINITVVMSYSVVVVESQLYYILKIPLVVRKLLIKFLISTTILDPRICSQLN